MYSLNPFSLDLIRDDISKAELRQYFDRFVGALAERTTMLTEAVRADSAFGSWVPDMTPKSLESLGAWFVANVQTRPRTKAEVFVEASKTLLDLPVPPVTLTDRTFSLASDVGMYFAQVLIRCHPHLTWTLPLGSKNFIDYGQPVLRGFRGGLILNPVRVATNVAWGISRGKEDQSALRSVLDVWLTYVETPRPADDPHPKSGV